MSVVFPSGNKILIGGMQPPSTSTGTNREFDGLIRSFDDRKYIMRELSKGVLVLDRIMRKNGGRFKTGMHSLGKYRITFEGGNASSVRYGGLTDEENITDFAPRRGVIENYKELWGTIKFNQTDLYKQKGASPKAVFVNMYKEQLASFLRQAKRNLSKNLATGGTLATILNASAVSASANHPKISAYSAQDAASGTTGSGKKFANLYVTNVNQFTAGQRILLSKTGGRVNVKVTDKSPIDINAAPGVDDDTTHFTTDAKALARARALYPTAGRIRVVPCSEKGVESDLGSNHLGMTDIYPASFLNKDDSTSAAADTSEFFTSITDILKPTGTLWGYNKTDEEFLQAIQINGAGVGSGDNDIDIIEAIYNGLAQMASKCRDTMNVEVIMNMAWWAKCKRLIENQKGSFKVAPNTREVVQYDWSSIRVSSPGARGSVVLTGTQEWEPNTMGLIDWSTFDFYTPGLFQWMKSPDDDQRWQRKRTARGITYISDCVTMGDLINTNPGKNAYITGLPTPVLHGVNDVYSS